MSVVGTIVCMKIESIWEFCTLATQFCCKSETAIKANFIDEKQSFKYIYNWSSKPNGK